MHADGPMALFTGISGNCFTSVRRASGISRAGCNLGLVALTWLTLQAGGSSAMAADNQLRVGVTPRPPLVIDYHAGGNSQSGKPSPSTDQGSNTGTSTASSRSTSDARFGGLAIELFKDIAEAEGWNYRFESLTDEEAVEALDREEVDLLLAVVPEADRVGAWEYTQPFLTTHLAALTRGQSNSVWKYAKALLNGQFWSSVFWLSVLLLIVGTACWMLERSGNDNQFRRRPAKGIWDGFYWAGVTMSTIGYGDQTPKSNAGRALALLWMLIAMAVTSTLTASIVSVVRKTDSEAVISRLPADLRGKRVAVVRGSYAASYLRDHGMQFETAPDLSGAVQALTKEEVEVVLGMRATLAAATPGASSGGGGAFSTNPQITSTRLKPQGYAMAVATSRSELLTRLNRRLLVETRQPDWDAKVNRFLQSDRDE